MVNRFTAAQSTVAMRRWGLPAIVMLAAVAALTALNRRRSETGAPRAPTEATAPRDAGEPIMAIVSIKSQQVTFYDADGWILRAPVSTGTTGRETPAGVFAVSRRTRTTTRPCMTMPGCRTCSASPGTASRCMAGRCPGMRPRTAACGCPLALPRTVRKTRIGMRVIISPNDAEPVEFSHPRCSCRTGRPSRPRRPRPRRSPRGGRGCQDGR
jgi:L,D-transpeptidase catalytic domain.